MYELDHYKLEWFLITCVLKQSRSVYIPGKQTGERFQFSHALSESRCTKWAHTFSTFSSFFRPKLLEVVHLHVILGMLNKL